MPNFGKSIPKSGPGSQGGKTKTLTVKKHGAGSVARAILRGGKASKSGASVRVSGG